ncbi:hypothetical protein MRX96_042664 [Rhipicephalus microplus]
MVKSGSDEDGMRLGSKFRATVAGLSPRASRADLGHLTPEERSILARVWQKEDEFETLVKKSQTPPLTPPTSQPTSTATSTPDNKSCDKVFPGVALKMGAAGVPPSSATAAAPGTNKPRGAHGDAASSFEAVSHLPQGHPGGRAVPHVRRLQAAGVRRLRVVLARPAARRVALLVLPAKNEPRQARAPSWLRNAPGAFGSPNGERTTLSGSCRTLEAWVAARAPGAASCSVSPSRRRSVSKCRCRLTVAALPRRAPAPSSSVARTRARPSGSGTGFALRLPERRHSYQKPSAGQERDASSDSSLEDDYLPRAGRLRRKSRLQRHKSRTAADEEDSEGNEWRSNTSSSSALDSLDADGGPPPPAHPTSSHRGGRLGVLTRYSSESSDVSDLSGGRGAPGELAGRAPQHPERDGGRHRAAAPVGGPLRGSASVLHGQRPAAHAHPGEPAVPVSGRPPTAPAALTRWTCLARSWANPERRASAPEGDNIKIVIDDVDSQGPPPTPLRKRVLLQRDPADTGARTRGFGMRVMGGKKAPDGHLYAAVAWVLAGSSADLAGLKQGDVILEWNGTSLVDRSYEEVCAILDKSPHSVELVVETGRKMSNRELRASTGNIPSRKSSTCSVGEGAATRRKLPKTPDEICNKAHVQGELGVRLWYDGTDLEVTVLGARGLPPRRSYVKLRLHEPGSGLRGPAMKTPISEPVTRSGVEQDVRVPLARVPRGPLPGPDRVGPPARRHQRLPGGGAPEAPLAATLMDLPPEDLIRSSSMDSMLLHPDDAWQGNPVERKSSAPSVYSVSTSVNPKNRQLLAQDSLPELYASSPTQTPERAKSASFKVRRNVNLPDTTAMDERRSLPRRKLSRTVSLKSDERVNHVPVNKGRPPKLAPPMSVYMWNVCERT